MTEVLRELRTLVTYATLMLAFPKPYQTTSLTVQVIL